MLVWDPVTDSDLSYFAIDGVGLGYSYHYVTSPREPQTHIGTVSRQRIPVYILPTGWITVCRQRWSCPQADVLRRFMMPREHSQFNYQGILKLCQAAWDDARCFLHLSVPPMGARGRTRYCRRLKYPVLLPGARRRLYEWMYPYCRRHCVGLCHRYVRAGEYISSGVYRRLTPPSVPTGFKGPHSGYVELEWMDPRKMMWQYRVYRALSEDGPTKCRTSGSAPSIVIEGQYGEHHYRLTVLDVAGNESEAAGPVVASRHQTRYGYLFLWLGHRSQFPRIWQHLVFNPFDIRAMDDRLLDSILGTKKPAQAG